MVLLPSQVTRYTSALTLQVLGNAKGVFTTALSIFIFRNPFTVTSVGGYLITVAVCLSKKQQAAAAASLLRHLAHAHCTLPQCDDKVLHGLQGVGCYAAAKRYQTAQKTSLTSTRD